MNLIRTGLLIAIAALTTSGGAAFAETFVVGDRVAVSAATTKVMSGEESLGNISRGTEFAVEQVNGAWLRGTMTVGGKKVSGWVKASDVARATKRSGNPDAVGTEIPRSSPKPATSSRGRSDMENFQKTQETFRRMLPRYNPKSDFPATMYGFLPIRQGFPDSLPADADYLKALTSGSDLMWAGFPFDPSTAREPETVRLLQSLPANAELNIVLEKLRQRAAEKKDGAETEGSTKLLNLAEAHPDLPVVLEKLSRRLFTDAREIIEARQQQVAGQRSADDPQAMNSLAWLFFIRRMSAGLEVETIHHQMLEWARKKYGDGHPLTSRFWNNLALLRHDCGDFEAARRILVQVLLQRAEKPLAADVPLLLINLARVLESEGSLPDSLRCSEVARAASRSLSEQSRALVAQSFLREFADPRLPETDGGPFYMRSGIAHRPALFNYVQFGSGAVRAEGNETESTGFEALSMTNIIGAANQNDHRYVPYMKAGAHFMRVGDHASAERFQRKAIELSREQFENATQQDLKQRIAMCYQFLGSTLETTGNHEAAIEAFAEGIKIQRPLWEQMLKQAQAQVSAGRDQLPVLDQTFVPLLQLHARTHAELGRLDDAERLYREALVEARRPTAISKNLQTAKYSYVPECEAHLAGVLWQRGKTQEAEKLLRDILAADYLRWAFATWKETRTVPSLSGLATIFAAKGTPNDTARATQMFHDAYLFRTVGGAFSGIERESHQPLIDYARTLQRTGRQAEVVQLLSGAIAGIEAARRQVGGDEVNRARYFSELTKHDPFSMLAQLQIEVGESFSDHFGVGEFGPKAAFDTLEQGRGRALLDLMSRGGGDVSSTAMTHARNRNDQALIQRVTQLRSQEQTARQQVAQIVERGAAVASNAAAVAQLQAELQKAREAEIQAKRDLFDIAKEMLEKEALKPLTSQQAAKLLEPTEAILVYDVGQERSARLVVWPDGKVDGEFLKWPDDKPVAEKELSMSIADFFQDVSREEAASTNSTKSTKAYAPDELRQALVPDPLLEKLKGCSRLFIVGDGPLHRLPFESLFIDEEGKQVLLDQLPPMVYGPSATILLHSRILQQKPSVKSRLELVALGDPQFARDATSGSVKGPATETAAAMLRTRALSRFGKLTPLPGTRAEIEVIQKTMAASGKANEAQVKILSGPDATITNLVRDVDQPRFLHLATHGLAEGGRKAYDSALALAVPESVTPDDTGFLRLSDLLAQWGGKLNGTELVVLSACRTARGEMESGDGFVALTWGFLFAGSQNVVASLWEVDDTATALLMSRLYENLLGSFEQPRVIAGKSHPSGTPMPRAAALQEAKTWLRTLTREQAQESVQRILKTEPQLPRGDRPFADSYFWAAFLLFGGGSH